MPIINISLPALYPKQHAFIMDRAKTTVCYGSTKSGKTAGMQMWLLSLAADSSNGYRYRNYYWFSPVHSQAKVPFDELCELLRASGLPKQDWTPNLTELSI